MNIEPLVTAQATGRRLVALIGNCDNFSWASAWVTETPAFAASLKAAHKMHRCVIGTHQYITDVGCLTQCEGVAGVKAMLPIGRLFHPKVYAFRHGEQISVYLGSANLTGNGMERNVECGVLLTADAGHPKLEPYFGFIAQQFAGATKIDRDFIATYKANNARVQDAHEEIERFVPLKKPTRAAKKAAHQVDPNTMTWANFLRLVREDKLHGPEPRLRVLAEARRIFDRGEPFHQLPSADQRRLAGMLRPATQDGVDWGFFGQMSAYGSYYRVLEEHADVLTRALDHIPLREAVKRRHFDAYLAEIASIKDPPVRIGLGTRLLAMKRPDQFVCIDSANRDGLCGYFGVAPTTTSLDNYWERIVDPMRQMPWWLAEMPGDHKAQEIWMGRAAMLDAIYYVPDS